MAENQPLFIGTYKYMLWKNSDPEKLLEKMEHGLIPVRGEQVISLEDLVSLINTAVKKGKASTNGVMIERVDMIAGHYELHKDSDDQ